MQIKSYSYRILDIRRPGDEDKQLERAKSLIQRLRKSFTEAETIEKKLEINEALRLAEWSRNKMQQTILTLQSLVQNDDKEGLRQLHQLALVEESALHGR